MENYSLRDNSQTLRGNLHLCPPISYCTQKLRQTEAPENVALVVKWHPVCSINLHKQEGADMWQPSDVFFKQKKKNTKPKTNKVSLIHIWNTVGTKLLALIWWGKKTARGSFLTKIQYPKEYPNLPKTEECASERYGQEEGKPHFCIHSRQQSLRPQRSMLHLWGCSGVRLRLGKPNLIADINIYVFLNLLIFYCGCTIFPDGLIWPLSVIQNPEEISKLKRKK